MDEVADRAEIRRLQARVAELEELGEQQSVATASHHSDFREFYRTAPVGLCLVDASLRYVHVNELLASMNGRTVAEHIGRPLHEVIPEVAPLIAPIFRRVLETGETVTAAEVEADAPGTPYHRHIYLVTYQPFGSKDGKPAGVSTVVEDVTELKRTERRLRTTIRELDHRVKNTLALVAALADHTARASTSLEEFMQTYGRRIAALARMHGPLTSEVTQSVTLSELVSLVVLPVCAVPDNVSVEGVDVRVSSGSVRPLGLALHELATNAVKFGSLSTRTGRVTIDVRTEAGEAGRSVRIEWIESGGPPVEASSRRGSGSTLIEQTLPYEMDAVVRLELAPAGARCEIVLPVRDGVV
jgi:two-component system CheB/CheR fusion protein